MYLCICVHIQTFSYTGICTYMYTHIYICTHLSSLRCDLPFSSPWPFAYSLSRSLLQWLFNSELFSASHFLVKEQVVLPPMPFVPMTLSQTFALAISILLPLIAHWTWSWVNGLVLNRLEKISFSLSKLNKNKEIKLNTKLCLNNSRVVTWGRKLKDKADDLPRTSAWRGTVAGMRARMSAII